MSAIHAAVWWGLSHVSITAIISIVLEINKSVRETVFYSHGANVSNGQATVAPDLRSRIKT